MKLIYCNHSLSHPGGMERVMLNKISWLVSHMGWEVLVVTTNQQGLPTFYPLPDGVRMIDLDINYAADNNRSLLSRSLEYLRKRRKHKQALKDLLFAERPDIVVSLYPSESSFIPEIKDGSKKVLELHLSRQFRLQYGRKGLVGLLDKLRSWLDVRIASKFDRFIVLTEEDKADWGKMENIESIPNAARIMTDKVADPGCHRLIAVGRLDYQKGFDRLVDAWAKVCDSVDVGDWQLDIFGQGYWHDMLENRISQHGIQERTHINPPTQTIEKEYLASSVIVMSSHYEGLPMVLVEAMSLGLPAVSFDCKCGPKDIIEHGVNGYLVPEGDVDALAEAMKEIMMNDSARFSMAREACKVRDRFSEENIMNKWVNLFEDLIK